jgi:hypothetical protein
VRMPTRWTSIEVVVISKPFIKRAYMSGSKVPRILPLLLTLSACSSQPLQPIDVSAVGAVQSELKRQVAIYIGVVKNLAEGKNDDGPAVFVNGKPVRIPKHDFWCGTGSIDFDISAVKAELTTTLDTTNAAKFGLSAPITIGQPGTAAKQTSGGKQIAAVGQTAGANQGSTGSPTFGQSRETVNAQTLDYNLWPLPIERQGSLWGGEMPTESEIASAPIARVLLDLRNALILSSAMYDYSTDPPTPKSPQACFVDYNPDKPSADPGDLFKIALTITGDRTVGVSINVAPLTLTPTGESKSTTGNTLFISFVQRGVKEIQKLKDSADSACKHPNELSFECIEATLALTRAMHDPGIGVTRLDRSKPNVE